MRKFFKTIIPVFIIGLLLGGAASVFSQTANTIAPISPWMYGSSGIQTTRTQSTSTKVLVGQTTTSTNANLQVLGTASISSLANSTSACITANSSGILSIQSCGTSGAITGNGTSTQVAYFNSSSSLTSSAGLVFDGSYLVVPAIKTTNIFSQTGNVNIGDPTAGEVITFANQGIPTGALIIAADGTVSIFDPLGDETGIVKRTKGEIQTATAGTDYQLPYWTLSSNSLYPTSTSYKLGIGTTDVTSLLNVYGNAKIGQSVTSTAVKTFDIAGNLNYDQVADITKAQHEGMTFATTTGGTLSPGTYYYNVNFYTAEGENSTYNSGYSTASTTLLTTSSVVISNIPTSTDPRVIGRKLYRSTSTDGANQVYFQYLFATIANNTATTYTDTGAALNTNDYAYWKSNTTAGVAYIDGVKLYSASPFNTTFGYGVLNALTRGSGNAGFGSYTLNKTTTGVNNTGFGHYAVYDNTTGSGNVGIGYATLQGNTTGGSNIAVGRNALRNNSGYSYTANTAVGDTALGFLNASNNYNTAIGYYAGLRNQGSYNTFVGGYAGNLSTATTTGDYNLVLGYEAGRSMGRGGDKNILIGYQVELLASTTDNQLNIGNVLYGTGLGVGSTPSATGKIGIGTTTPAFKLHIAGATSTIINDTSYTPPFSTSTCITGQDAWDANYLYKCISTNQWARATLNTW